MSSIIQVDRSIRPDYSDGGMRPRKLLHPELETIGPAEFDVRGLMLWVPPDQPESWLQGCLTGQSIYNYLEANNMLSKCLSLRDLEEIKKKGIRFYQKHFAHDDTNMNHYSLSAWKSVVEATDGGGVVQLYVPVLHYGDGRVFVGWGCLIFSNWCAPLSRTPLFAEETL